MSASQSRFWRHSLDAQGIEQTNYIREYCRELEDTIYAQVPDGREKSLALTKLEEVCMWANKGIANQYPVVDEGD